jgi:hypothetical protein
MRVLKGTYRVTLWEFVTACAKNIKDLTYTSEEAHDCIEMINNGILQFLKIYVINGDLKSCCKLITIARDFLNNKFADRTGRYYLDYSDDDRFFFAHCVKCDYMECAAEDETKIQRLIEIIGAVE